MMKQLAAALVLAAVSGTVNAQDLLGDRDAKQIITEFEENFVPEMPTLNIGDEAPAFKVNHWSKGTPFSEFEKGNVYLVDFWATWCGPCIRIMPHLTELQEKHEADGLQIVGVSIWEDLEGDEHAAHVDEFVSKNDEKMGYAVATGTKLIESDWMNAAIQRGIPTVMIVDRDGKLGWIGYGSDPSLDTHLVSILNDEHDVETLGADRMAAIKKDAKPNHFQHFAELAEEDRDEAAVFGQAMLEVKYPENPNAYNAVAWTIVEHEGWSEDAVSYASKIAKKACEMTDWEQPHILDTLAWAQFRSGDAEAAIKTETKAMEMLDESDPSIADYEKALKTFKGG